MKKLSTAGALTRPPFVRSGDWWPGGIGHPNNVGSLNGARYAYFARARRLAIERDGVVTLHDTLHHEISGVSQPESLNGALQFTSQNGPVDAGSLPVVTA